MRPVSFLGYPHTAVQYKEALLSCAALNAALLISFFLLAPGLSGGFTLDDYPNLEGLTRLVEDPSREQFKHFILSGTSSTLGRPLALATFAAQADYWPNQPSVFIRTNLLLHLLNGTLLCWFLLKVFELFNFKAIERTLLALITTAVWLIHPLQASAVLYIVQRMVLLSTLFAFSGLLLYLHGRLLALGGKTTQGFTWMSLGVGLGLIFGVLSKENAILLPLFVLVIEYTLLRSIETPIHWRGWAILMLGTPLLALAAYLTINIDNFLLNYEIRDFTLKERLLTETRVLFDYQKKLFLPSPGEFGLFFDDYSVSRSLWEPYTTLASVAGVLALLGIGFFAAKNSPMLSFGILWFFSAHFLESTFIPLELYFEHRNYLAIVGPLVALVYFGIRVFSQSRTPTIRAILPAGALAFCLLISYTTYREAILWGSPLLQAATWAAEKPESKRAQFQYANRLLQHGFPERSTAVYRDTAEKWIEEAVLPLAIREIGCFYPISNPPDYIAVETRLRRASAGQNRTVYTLNRLVTSQEDGICPDISTAETRDYVLAAMENPFFQRQRSQLLLLAGRTSYLLGEIRQALAYHEQAYDIDPHMRIAVELALRFTELGQPQKAIAYLDHAAQNERISFAQKWRYKADLERLRKGILIAGANTTGGSDERQ